MPLRRRRVFEMSDGNDVWSRTHYLEMALFSFDVVAGDDGDSSTMAAVA